MKPELSVESHRHRGLGAALDPRSRSGTVPSRLDGTARWVCDRQTGSPRVKEQIREAPKHLEV